MKRDRIIPQYKRHHSDPIKFKKFVFTVSAEKMMASPPVRVFFHQLLRGCSRCARRKSPVAPVFSFALWRLNQGS